VLIDCDSCAARPHHCSDCVVPLLLGAPPAAPSRRWELDCDEQIALVRLAEAGLVPPLRLVAEG
jgi:hypothetical protein